MENYILDVPVIQKTRKTSVKKSEPAASSCCAPKNNAAICCAPSQTKDENDGACWPSQPIVPLAATNNLRAAFRLCRLNFLGFPENG